MIYLNYDLARQLVEERRALAARHAIRRRAVEEPALPQGQPGDAEVIELVFGAHCESDRIGA